MVLDGDLAGVSVGRKMVSVGRKMVSVGRKMGLI